MTQVFVVQTDYWVLIIAFYTFLVLADYKLNFSWIEEHRIVLWILPWFLSVLWAAIGLGVVGYGDIGAWCWFTSDRVRLFVNFIPRWLIITTILALYFRLSFLLRKAHARFMSFSDEASRSAQALSSTTENVISRNEMSYLSSSPDDNCEQSWGATTHVRIGDRLPVLKKISYQMMTYPLAYLLIWSIPTSIRIYQAVTSKPAPFGIATVDKACIVIQGLVDAIIYGLNESRQRIWYCGCWLRKT